MRYYFLRKHSQMGALMQSVTMLMYTGVTIYMFLYTRVQQITCNHILVQQHTCSHTHAAIYMALFSLCYKFLHVLYLFYNNFTFFHIKNV